MAAGEENSVCPFLFLKSLEWLCSTPVKKPPVTTTNLDSLCLSHEDGPSQVAVSRLQLRRRLRPVPNKPQTRDRVITLKKQNKKKQNRKRQFFLLIIHTKLLFKLPKKEEQVKQNNWRRLFKKRSKTSLLIIDYIGSSLICI